MMRPPIGVSLFSLSCVVVASCSGGGPSLAPVSGRVTYKGKPVVNAAVSFSPDEGKARIATGQTDSDGRFTLGTYAISDGAAVGSHRVSVIARGPDRPPKAGEVGSGMPGEMMPGDPVIPAKYFSAESSGLTAEVKRGKNTINLELPD